MLASGRITQRQALVDTLLSRSGMSALARKVAKKTANDDIMNNWSIKIIFNEWSGGIDTVQKTIYSKPSETVNAFLSRLHQFANFNSNVLEFRRSYFEEAILEINLETVHDIQDGCLMGYLIEGQFEEVIFKNSTRPIVTPYRVVARMVEFVNCTTMPAIPICNVLSATNCTFNDISFFANIERVETNDYELTELSLMDCKFNITALKSGLYFTKMGQVRRINLTLCYLDKEEYCPTNDEFHKLFAFQIYNTLRLLNCKRINSIRNLMAVRVVTDENVINSDLVLIVQDFTRMNVMEKIMFDELIPRLHGVPEVHLTEDDKHHQNFANTCETYMSRPTSSTYLVKAPIQAPVPTVSNNTIIPAHIDPQLTLGMTHDEFDQYCEDYVFDEDTDSDVYMDEDDTELARQVPWENEPEVVPPVPSEVELVHASSSTPTAQSVPSASAPTSVSPSVSPVILPPVSPSTQPQVQLEQEYQYELANYEIMDIDSFENTVENHAESRPENYIDFDGDESFFLSQ